jgi:hypothetical protein
MTLNLSANLLGLDNAATPLGLQAMRELQTSTRARGGQRCAGDVRGAQHRPDPDPSSVIAIRQAWR